ncbi:MAG: hypothetical protein NE328_23265 [Lentisphaeraceae bacterium]|nr:hypothetical protein [Lentisphaeraceae bacterium]
MKFLMIIILLGGAAYLYNENSTWSPEKKNKEIEKALKEDLIPISRKLKAHPFIKDATIKHDKKGFGIVFYVKLASVPGVSTSELTKAGKEMKKQILYATKKSKDKEAERMRTVISKGIYLMYRYYLPSGQLISSFKLTSKDFK